MEEINIENLLDKLLGMVPVLYSNLVGNPVDGFRCIGVYDNPEDAIDWQEGCDESCWLIEIEVEK